MTFAGDYSPGCLDVGNLSSFTHLRGSLQPDVLKAQFCPINETMVIITT